MKKIIALILVLIMTLSAFNCFAASPSPSGNLVRAVAVSFPENLTFKGYEEGCLKVIRLTTTGKLIRTFVTLPNEECVIIVFDKNGEMLDFVSEYRPSSQGRCYLTIENPDEFSTIYVLIMDAEAFVEEEAETEEEE